MIWINERFNNFTLDLIYIFYLLFINANKVVTHETGANNHMVDSNSKKFDI